MICLILLSCWMQAPAHVVISPEPQARSHQEQGFKREAAQGQKAILCHADPATRFQAGLTRLMNMHILLWIGNTDALPVKFRLYLLDDIPMNLPVITCIYPGTANEVD